MSQSKLSSTNKSIIFITCCGLLAGLFLKLFVIDVLHVSGRSMEGSIHDGSTLVVNKLAYGIVKPFGQSLVVQWKSPAQNDVVIYLYNNKIVVKRCVAVEGQSLEYSTDKLYTLKTGDKNIPLTESQYLRFKDIKCVPDGYILAIGDNYEESVDSREYGFVNKKECAWKSFMQMNGYLRKGRVLGLCGCVALFTGLIVYKYAALALKKTPETKTYSPLVQRGSIFDKNGKTLAVSTNFYHVGVTPSAIKDLPQFVHLFAPVLKVEENELASTITQAANSSFVYIKKKIDQNDYEILKEITDKNGLFSAVRFDRIPGRIYPEKELASQVIGYMGSEGTGLAGIEYTQQNLLSPPVNPSAPVDVAGKNIYLTLDAGLQFKLEKIAAETIKKTQAANLMLVAAEAKTGEILSYISLPSTDLNEYTKASPEEMKDLPATQSYEPGSVFKIFSISSFLDSGAISEDEFFLCDGIYERKTKSGERIKITCLDHHGWITAREALKFSCNDALAQMSEKIESEQFLTRLRSFGFGSKTGIELPGETQGSVRNTSDRFWSARSKPTIAIGQEISVSALQMVQAATAIANGGYPVQLTLIKKITSQEGVEEYIHAPAYKNQIISEKTARYILSCMQTVAQTGTGSRANLSDISIGVKTGTAQMADPINGGYSKTDFISNCIAIFPIEDPEIILYIVVEKAKGETYAGRIVAPVIAEASSAIIDHLGMSRGGAASLAHSGLIKIQNDEPIQLGSTMPDFTGMAKRNLLPLLNRKDLKIKINGDGWVTSQSPEAGTTLTQDSEIELFLE